jgi:hypothetical protein
MTGERRRGSLLRGPHGAAFVLIETVQRLGRRSDLRHVGIKGQVCTGPQIRRAKLNRWLNDPLGKGASTVNATSLDYDPVNC